MKKSSREALDAYYSEADSWAKDRNNALRTSRRIAWMVAGAACLVAICEALALLFLTPLKTVEPYTLLVDRQTGFVQQLKPLEPQMISGEAALTRSFLVQYIIAREGFDINSLQSDYRKVALWSAGRARSAYLSAMQATNPQSPLARLPRSSLIDVQVKSVTSMENNAAMVRFDTWERDAGGRDGPTQSWVAVLHYEYSGEPMSVSDRMINPLGFRVTAYRKNVETLAPREPEASMLSRARADEGQSAPEAPPRGALP